MEYCNLENEINNFYHYTYYRRYVNTFFDQKYTISALFSFHFFDLFCDFIDQKYTKICGYRLALTACLG